jgi:hypothetical protein
VRLGAAAAEGGAFEFAVEVALCVEFVLEGEVVCCQLVVLLEE